MSAVAPALALCLSALVAPMAASAQESEPRFLVEVEAGPVWQSDNEVEIPNDGTATRFSFSDLTGNGPWFTGRVTLHWRVAGRHSVAAVLAPLGFEETGTLEQPTRFAGEEFAPGEPTTGKYVFNSWRVGYRYRYLDRGQWKAWVGVTGKIRDAEVKLTQGDVSANDTDVGFVPLLHLSADWAFAPRWHLLLELDALGGGPGRAEDFSVRLGYDLNDRIGLTVGYRTVEGGADVDEVYNFAWFNAGVVTARFRF